MRITNKPAIVLLVIWAMASTSIAQENCKRLELGGFSFCPPEGWSIKEQPPGSDSKWAVGAASDNFAPNVGMSIKHLAASPDKIASILADHLKEIIENGGGTEAKLLDRRDFATLTNLNGVKLSYQSKKGGFFIRTTQYLFAGTGDTLFITFMALEKQSQDLDQMFDRSVKSLRLDK